MQQVLCYFLREVLSAIRELCEAGEYTLHDEEHGFHKSVNQVANEFRLSPQCSPTIGSSCGRSSGLVAAND